MAAQIPVRWRGEQLLNGGMLPKLVTYQTCFRNSVRSDILSTVKIGGHGAKLPQLWLQEVVKWKLCVDEDTGGWFH